MEKVAGIIAVAIISYIIGSVSFAVIFGKIFGKIDVRHEGSKNAGSTNVLRTVGPKAAILTLVCDCLKGVLAVLFALLLGNLMNYGQNGQIYLITAAGFFAILGHTFPIFFKFKGGKGVATALGILLITNWHIGLICLVYALVLMALTRMVSLGSVAAAILYPILVMTGVAQGAYLVHGDGFRGFVAYAIFSVLIAGLVIFNHRSNIRRLMDGEENRLDFSKFKKKKAE